MRSLKQVVGLGALLLSAVLASCSSSDSGPKGSDAGAGNDAAGQTSAAGAEEPGGAGAPSAAAGDSSGGGDTAGEGGEAGASTAGPFSITGTVYAPKDGSVEGTVVIACAWIDGDCDEQLSQAVQVAKGGASAPYVLTDLASGPTYLVLFWKDVNGSGEVDDDDYVGVVADESGAARAFTSAAADADGIMAIQQAATATTVPAELVGDWFLVNTNIGVTNDWEFAADGTAKNSFTLNSAVCGGGAGLANSSQGMISVDGDQLTYSPTSGQKTDKPCSGDATVTPYYPNARHFTWHVGPSTKQQGGTALFLTDQQDTSGTEAEFQKL